MDSAKEPAFNIPVAFCCSISGRIASSWNPRQVSGQLKNLDLFIVYSLRPRGRFAAVFGFAYESQVSST